MYSPKRRSGRSGPGGFTASWMARFSDAVPAVRLRVGESTWICSGGMPMLLGSRVFTSSTMVSAG